MAHVRRLDPPLFIHNRADRCPSVLLEEITTMRLDIKLLIIHTLLFLFPAVASGLSGATCFFCWTRPRCLLISFYLLSGKWTALPHTVVQTVSSTFDWTLWISLTLVLSNSCMVFTSSQSSPQQRRCNSFTFVLPHSVLRSCRPSFVAEDSRRPFDPLYLCRTDSSTVKNK